MWLGEDGCYPAEVLNDGLKLIECENRLDSYLVCSRPLLLIPRELNFSGTRPNIGAVSVMSREIMRDI